MSKINQLLEMLQWAHLFWDFCQPKMESLATTVNMFTKFKNH